MKGSFKISLKANERIFINGAVLRVDRKTSIEFLNDVHFLLENHVLQAEDANTPLRQLYFSIQIMVMSPLDIEPPLALFRSQLPALLVVFKDVKIVTDLKEVDRLVHEKRYYDAMKIIRALYPLEAELLGGQTDDSETPHMLPERQVATG